MTDEGLPANLIRYLADSEVKVVSWSAETEELVLRIEKDIGLEVGLLRFGGVAHVNLIPCLTIAGITQSHDRVGDAEPDAEQSVFTFEESWGASYFVVAETINYTIEA